MNLIYLIFFLGLLPVEEPADTIMLSGVDIVASMKIDDKDAANAFSCTTVGRAQIENRHYNSLKEISSIAPNFYQPDYGSRMTSSIYVRGFGSRIDQPVVGLSIDEVPVLNKNCYDFDFFDIDKVSVIRGAQSSLYGRNTAAGAVNIKTLSPLNFQGKRLAVEYANENSLRVKASHYAAPTTQFGWSASLFYAHTDGYFENTERAEQCDEGDNISMRLRAQYLASGRWSVDNSFSMGYVDEGGYAYRSYNAATGVLAPVAYNDKSGYRRFNIGDGLVFKFYFDNFTLSSTTAYNYLDDCMRMDNDFLPMDYFTLRQAQKEHSFTQELVAKSTKEGGVEWLAGVFAMYKHIDMDAPVHFKKYGIDNLILKNANQYYYWNLGPDRELSFRENDFVINDEFDIPVCNVAAYAQAGYKWRSFNFQVGLRADYEYSMMDYDSYSLVHYKTYKNIDFYMPLETTLAGDKSVDAFELLPHVSLSYEFKRGNVYAALRRGFKSGGFNTQLFSDILQNKMTGDIIGNKQDTDAASTVYKPETTWNYELGTHLSPLSDGSLNISAALFYIDCRDQQLTVFPKNGTGRMMSNAGRSHSYGIELSANYKIGRMRLDASYGYAHAEFDEFLSNGVDYAGNILPLAPRETYSLNLEYNIPVSHDFANYLLLHVGYSAVGRIYWNEENSLSQSGYGLLSASLSWEKGHFGASLWGKNLLDKEYNTFYFSSIGNNFFAQGKPLQAGISLYLNL